MINTAQCACASTHTEPIDWRRILSGILTHRFSPSSSAVTVAVTGITVSSPPLPRMSKSAVSLQMGLWLTAPQCKREATNGGKMVEFFEEQLQLRLSQILFFGFCHNDRRIHFVEEVTSLCQFLGCLYWYLQNYDKFLQNIIIRNIRWRNSHIARSLNNTKLLIFHLI